MLMYVYVPCLSSWAVPRCHINLAECFLRGRQLPRLFHSGLVRRGHQIKVSISINMSEHSRVAECVCSKNKRSPPNPPYLDVRDVVKCNMKGIKCLKLA